MCAPPRLSPPSGAVHPPLCSLELAPHGRCVGVVDLRATTCPREVNSNPQPQSCSPCSQTAREFGARPCVCCPRGHLSAASLVSFQGFPAPDAPRSCPVGLDPLAQVRLRVRFILQPKLYQLRSLARCRFSSWHHTGLAEGENTGRSVM